MIPAARGSSRIREALQQRRQVWAQAESCIDGMAHLAGACIASLAAEGQIVFFGNGGSAAQADHLAAELVGRYLRERRPLPALALAANGALVTALANDYGYDQVFARQVQAVARHGDVLVGLSTSGRSPSVQAALVSGRRAGCVTALLTGAGREGDLPAVDYLVRVPSRETPVIQELHLFFGHLLCEIIEAEATEPAP